MHVAKTRGCYKYLRQLLDPATKRKKKNQFQLLKKPSKHIVLFELTHLMMVRSSSVEPLYIDPGIEYVGA